MTLSQLIAKLSCEPRRAAFGGDEINQPKNRALVPFTQVKRATRRMGELMSNRLSHISPACECNGQLTLVEEYYSLTEPDCGNDLRLH